ncbi:MAG TPA: hypothetical protein VMV72_15255 [Verrucomicrobiae bacterium]|nr:hypothetical protein [Verrucomicrobiae bacterium]
MNRPARATIWIVCLFFAWVRPGGAEEGAGGSPRLDELRVMLEKLNADNTRLKSELEQREAVIKLLTENLAIARTESELFQKKWAEAQLRAQTLGVDFRDPAATQTQRQLVESVRALYLAEAERQRVVEQLKQLLAVVQTNGDAAAEIERTKALLAATEHATSGSTPAGSNTGKTATLQSALVLDMNPALQLVVLNVGELQDVRVGMPFIVLRGDKVVARLKVVEVRRRICGALIEKMDKGVTLVAGDAARVTDK